MNQGKKITIFLETGLPKGVREVRIDQWSGKAICGPRNALQNIINRPEAESGACIYFLVSANDEGGLLDVYVGEADGFKARIKNHDYKKDWWQDVVFFMSNDKSLTKTGIKYLESICVQRLKQIGKCRLKNSNNPSEPSIPREDVSGLETFYENMATIMPLLGYDIFVQGGFLAKKDQVISPIFICKKGTHVTATAHLLEDGKMEVLKGSGAELKETSSFQNHPYKKLRDELVKMGRLVPEGDILTFSDNYVFDSSSAAAAIVQGRSASGPIEWKTKHDLVTLKEFINSGINL